MKVFISFNREDYRQRIRLLRLLHGMNQTEWSDYVGIAYKKWNHYERGYPIPRETAFILQKKVKGISTDWIWFGNPRGVEPTLMEKIEKLQRAARELGPPRIGEQERTRMVASARTTGNGRLKKP